MIHVEVLVNAEPAVSPPRRRLTLDDGRCCTGAVVLRARLRLREPDFPAHPNYQSTPAPSLGPIWAGAALRREFNMPAKQFFQQADCL